MFKRKILFNNIFINNRRITAKNIIKPKDPTIKPPTLEFRLKTLNDNGTGMKYNSKKELMDNISKLIDEYIASGMTYFDIDLSCDEESLYPKVSYQFEFEVFKETKLPCKVTYATINSLENIKKIDDVLSNRWNDILQYLKILLIKNDNSHIDNVDDIKIIEATYYPAHFNYYHDYLGYVTLEFDGVIYPNSQSTTCGIYVDTNSIRFDGLNGCNLALT